MAESDSNLVVISRKDAIAKGLKHYFTGKPCKHGHITKRYASSLRCFDCAQKDNETFKPRIKDWYVQNSEYQKKKSREWFRTNHERGTAARKAYAPKWWKKNPGKRRIYNHNRRFKYGAGRANYSVVDIDDIFNMQHGKCGYCKIDLVGKKFHVDHITPVSKGGSNLRSNLQILCKKCNQTKSFLDPIVYAQSIGLLL